MAELKKDCSELFGKPNISLSLTITLISKSDSLYLVSFYYVSRGYTNHNLFSYTVKVINLVVIGEFIYFKFEVFNVCI